MDFGSFRITKREVIVAIAITLVLIGIGFLINSAIADAAREEHEVYLKSLKIDNQPEVFQYAINTNIGYTLAYGIVNTVQPVSIKDIDGEYYKIEKEKQKYTEHIEQVAHTGSDGHIYYTTEVYYSWDWAGSETFQAPQFEFLGVTFDKDKINFGFSNYKETKYESGTIRYNYYIIPKTFDGTVFTFIQNNTINNSEFHKGASIDKVLDNKDTWIGTGQVVFWLFWIILIVAADFGYVYLENNYLED